MDAGDIDNDGYAEIYGFNYNFVDSVSLHVWKYAPGTGYYYWGAIPIQTSPTNPSTMIVLADIDDGQGSGSVVISPVNESGQK